MDGYKLIKPTTPCEATGSTQIEKEGLKRVLLRQKKVLERFKERQKEVLEMFKECQKEGLERLKTRQKEILERFKERQKEADEHEKEILKHIEKLESLAKIDSCVQRKINKLYRSLQYTPHNPEKPTGRDLHGLGCVGSKEWDLKTREEWKLSQYYLKYPYETPY
jgi:SMC interacting uncharacterized protein involved in chromosome segregation